MTGPVGHLRPGHQFSLTSGSPRLVVYTLVSAGDPDDNGALDLQVRLPEGDVVTLAATLSTPVRILGRDTSTPGATP